MGFSVTGRTFRKVGGKGFGTPDHNAAKIPTFFLSREIVGTSGILRENGSNRMNSHGKRSFFPVFALIVKKHLRGFA
jgi:hypothetical protein